MLMYSIFLKNKEKERDESLSSKLSVIYFIINSQYLIKRPNVNYNLILEVMFYFQGYIINFYLKASTEKVVGDISWNRIEDII